MCKSTSLHLISNRRDSVDDLMSKLQNILSTKEGQEQLKNLQNMFGGMGSPTPEPQAAPQPEQPTEPQQQSGGGIDFSAIAAMLSNMGGGINGTNGTSNNTTGNEQDSNTASDSSSTSSGMPNIDIGMIMKLQQAFSSMNTSDKNSQLLLALKPHFSEKRSKKVDQAITMMRLFSMLPMLKESGILSGLTGLVGL